jgi:hypothetical protein
MRAIPWAWLAAVLFTSACGGAPARAVRPDPPKIAGDECGAGKTHLRPLIVEWSSGDRASLEALSRRQLLVVKYVGCDLEVLRGCRAPGDYQYIAITPKRDEITMRDRDELYAELPLGAAELGGALETSRDLRLDMATGGMLESSIPSVRVDQLAGECDGASHVVSALAVGAFQLTSGSSARVGAKAGALGAGAGGESESTRRSLSRDGDLSSCRADADSPPARCRALLRLELLPLGARRPTCSDKERWNGEACEPLPLPVAISDSKRAALQHACKLGLKYACKAAEIVGEK